MHQIIFVCLFAMVDAPKYWVTEIDPNLMFGQYRAKHWGPWHCEQTSANLKLFFDCSRPSSAALRPAVSGSVPFGADIVSTAASVAMLVEHRPNVLFRPRIGKDHARLGTQEGCDKLLQGTFADNIRDHERVDRESKRIFTPI